MKKSALTVTIEEGLSTLDSSLAISVPQNAIISTRQSEVSEIVIKQFNAIGTTLTGACARNTMIQPLSERMIDLFVLLEPDSGQLNTPGGLMRKLEAVLQESYPEAIIATDGRSVEISFSEFIFHVAPSFFRENKGYIIADAKNQQWIKTDPNMHYYALDDENHRQKGLLLPVVRIIKYWNECNDSLFDNYYLELLLKETLSKIKISSYVQAVKYFFSKAINLLVFTIDDPADNGKQMEGLKDIHNMLEAMESFRVCHAHIVEAEKFEKAGDLVSAYKAFGKIFDGHFPGYVDMMAKKLDANGITGVEALQIMRDAT